MAERTFDPAAVFSEAQSVVAALSADVLCSFDPEPLLLRDNLADQQAITVAAFMLVKTVLFDMATVTPLCVSRYLADVGLRVAREAERSA